MEPIPRKRKLVTFDPCGPVSEMIFHETKHKSRGAKTRLMEEALYTFLRMKYPKLAARYEALKMERV